MPSLAFTRQYREWLARHFQRVYRQGSESLSQAITAQRPDLVTPALKELAICLHTRGAVSLLDGNQQGWHDIQAGYLADLYAIRFAIPLKTGSCARAEQFDPAITWGGWISFLRAARWLSPNAHRGTFRKMPGTTSSWRRLSLGRLVGSSPTITTC